MVAMLQVIAYVCLSLLVVALCLFDDPILKELDHAGSQDLIAGLPTGAMEDLDNQFGAVPRFRVHIPLAEIADIHVVDHHGGLGRVNPVSSHWEPPVWCRTLSRP